MPVTLEERPVSTVVSGSGRIHGIDALRGLCVILMAIFHFGYDLYAYCGFPAAMVASPFMVFCQVASSRGFMLLAGFSCRLSRDNAKRGLRVLAFAVILGVVTRIWGDPIRFGILHLLGCSMLLWAATHKLWEKLPGWLLSLLAFGAFLVLNAHFPMVGERDWLYAFGVMYPGFYSSDYYPLLPWFFLFLTGAGLSAYRHKIGGWLRDRKVPLLNWLGRHSLGFYLIHQPVLVVVSLAIAFLTGHSFSVS